MQIDRLQYEIAGEGEPVVFLHGFTGTRRTWREVCSELKGYQCILIDLPGHGETNLEIHSMNDCCYALARLLEWLKIDKMHLVGYSMGGRVALSFANYYPDFVHTLVLESASPGLREKVERADRKERDDRLARFIMEKGIRNFVDYWEGIPLFASQKELNAGTRQKIREERLSQTKEGLVMSLRTMGTGVQPSWWERLTGLDQQVLLIAGEKDTKFVAINRLMQKEIPNAALSVCPETGHAVHVENSRIFGKIVEAFLNENNITT